MKNFKKVLSLVLTVVMIMSTLVLAAFAYTAGPMTATTDINVKYEVTQVPSAYDSINGGTLNAVNNNLYAVTVYVYSSDGIDTLMLPIHFNKNHFDVVTGHDGDEAFYNEDLGESTIYCYKLGQVWQEDTMYKRDGTVVTSKATARWIPLGSSSSTAPTITTRFYDTTTDLASYNTWKKNLDTDTYGITMFQIADAIINKNAYLNTSKNAITSDYTSIITYYFQRKAAFTEADVVGDSFGVLGTDKHGLDGTTDISGLPSYFGSESVYAPGTPKINVVNATVAARVSSLAGFTATGAAAQQIKFNGTTANDTVDYRFVAQFSKTMFNLQYDAALKVTSTNIAEVGFVLANKADAKTYANLTAFTGANLTGTAHGAELATGIRKCATANISTTTAGDCNFAFSARITGIAVTGGTVASEYNAVPYVVLTDGTVYFGSSLLTSNIQGRYDTYKTAAGIA